MYRTESDFKSYRSASEFAREKAKSTGMTAHVHRTASGKWYVNYDDGADPTDQDDVAIDQGWNRRGVDEQIQKHQVTLYGDDADLGDRPDGDWSESGDDMDSSDFDSYQFEPEEY